MGRIKAGSSTGLYDANGEEIFEGQYVYTEDGKKWRVNAYKQAIPYGEGAAVKLSDLLKQGVTIMEPVSTETAADAFKGMGEAIGELGSAIDSLFPDTEKDGRGNVVVTEPEALREAEPLKTMQEATSQDLADELRRRGCTVKATKLMEI